MDNTLDPVTGQGTFQVQPVPDAAHLPSGVTPQWTSSDVTIATATPSGDQTTVSRVSDAGGEITLTVVLTLPDNSILQDQVVVTVPPVPVTPLTGVKIVQIA